MSMHKKPLTPLEEEGLRLHGLDIGTPSQLSDVFRHGIAWALSQAQSAPEPVQGEAVAWFTEDHLTDKSATTYNLDVAERWRAKGWPVTPLYTAAAKPDAAELWAMAQLLPGEGIEDAIARIDAKLVILK